MWLQICIFMHGIEARTNFLRIQVPMAYNQGTRVFPMQRLQQPAQGNPLGIRPGVFRFPVSRQAADITDSDRMTVMIPAMCSGFGFIPTRLDASVRRDHVVIPAAFPSTCFHTCGL